MKELAARENELKAKITQCWDEVVQHENDFDALYDRGEPRSSPEMVFIGNELILIPD